MFYFQTKNCDICRRIKGSSARRPPILSRKFPVSVSVKGEWVSQRCETRPNGVFLTRHLSFLSTRSWQGLYEFYRDPLCIQPHYSIAVKGTYENTGRSTVVSSASDYTFKTTRMKVKLQDFQMVNFMNSYGGSGCGKAGGWKLGVTQDVTGTDGCTTLGVELPHVEFEIMKTEYDVRKSYLYVGQRPSNFASLSYSRNRPTSFQNALVRCGTNNEIMDEITPVFETYAAQISSERVLHVITGTSSNIVASYSMILFASLVVLL